MVNPEPCKELRRRPQPLLTFIYPGCDCGSRWQIGPFQESPFKSKSPSENQPRARAGTPFAHRHRSGWPGQSALRRTRPQANVKSTSIWVKIKNQVTTGFRSCFHFQRFLFLVPVFDPCPPGLWSRFSCICLQAMIVMVWSSALILGEY